jgi:hypothetical protein
MLKWFVALWHARQRSLDRQILWPACVRQAKTVENARDAFLWHAQGDSAWTFLGTEEMLKQISELEAGK